MAYTMRDVIETLRSSRTFVLRHLDDLPTEHWDWQPYPECKSIRQILAHLITDDRAALDSLITRQEPDYGAYDVPPEGADDLLETVANSHAKLIGHIERTLADADLGAEVVLWGSKAKAGNLGYLSSEDYYHAGQIAFIRMAIDPTWDYYASVYGA